MNIIVDAMGGDHAPREIVKGAIQASREYKTDITLVGNENIIRETAAELGMSLGSIKIINAEQTVTMEDDPLAVVRAKKNSSMAIGLKELKSGGDAFVSAGNTGALHAGASLIIRSVAGVQRAAIATVLPFKKPILLIDCGANTNVTPEYLLQWAVMGSIYMNKLFGMRSPKVGLLNNGTEEHKGTAVCVEAYKLFSESDKIHFIGNIESREIPSSPCDVLVTDGFTGNIVLKLIEGMGKFMFSTLKELYSSGTASKLSFLAVKNNVMKIKKELDASEYGGAPLLGLAKPVIKAHGSSDATAIKNAIGQAIRFVETDVIPTIANTMAQMKKNGIING